MALLLAGSAAATERRGWPLPKRGQCPSNYTSSAHYCEPSDRAPVCVEKRGQCPGSMVTSGGYCCETR